LYGINNAGTVMLRSFNDLAALQQAHLDAVDDLVQAIKNRRLSRYLGPRLACPTVE
jgi:hypothetical protein